MRAFDLEILDRQPAADTGRPPLLFVHGHGHGAWAFEHWLTAAAEAGHPAYALSLRGHGGSPGRVRTARLGHYVEDVVRTAESIGPSTVLVGHSMGGLVVQRALTRYAAPAAVLVTPVPAHTAVVAYLGIARRRPLDALTMAVGGTLPMRPEYLFSELPPDRALPYTERCGPESALVQYQYLFRLPTRPPLGNPPVLVLAGGDDRLIPLRGIRATAARFSAPLREFPGMGHDLMLEPRWREPLQAILEWLAELPSATAGRGSG